MSIRTQLLTPKKAQELLNHQAPNRDLIQGQVKILAACMTAGDWIGTGVIKVTDDGKRQMWDGMHRCHAVITSGVPIMVRIEEASIEEQEVIDTGKRRTFGQTLTIKGYKNASNLAASVVGVGLLIGLAETGKYTGQPQITGQGREYTLHEKIRLVERHPELVECVRIVGSKGNKADITYPKGWLSAIRSVAVHLEAEEAFDRFLDRCITGVNLEEDEPEFLLRRHLVREQKKSSIKLPTTTRNSYWVKAWNMAFYGERGKSLQPSPLHFPAPEGLMDWYEDTEGS